MHEKLSRWWATISLRTKVTGVTVLLVTFGLLIAGTGTVSVLQAYLVSEVDTKLRTTSELFNGQPQWVELPGGRLSCSVTSGFTEAYYTAVVDPDGDMVCDNRDDDDALPDLSTVSLQFTSDASGAPFTVNGASLNEQWRAVADVRIVPDSPELYSFVVATNLSETNGIITQFAAIFFFFGVNVVVLGAALTRLLVTSTFAPLREVEATAARFADGDFSQRIFSSIPNTEVGRLSRSLNTMLARIDQAFKDRARTIQQMRRFVGDASHELRTPLVSVRGYAELYRMGALRTPEEIGQAMERIEKEAIRMGALVEDLLQLARLDEAKPLQLGPVDLVPLAHDAAMDAMASAPDRSVTVVLSPPLRDEPDEEPDATPEPVPVPTPAAANRLTGAFSRLRPRWPRVRPQESAMTAPTMTVPEVPAVVWAEENKIRQVITNLVGNALRFTPAGSPIEIGVQVDQRRGVGVLSVIDHGQGIAPQIREKIFQRFWRADTSRARDTGGSGLGLAIVSAIVQNHHGTVDVVETPGGGATFRVAIPLLSR